MASDPVEFLATFENVRNLFLSSQDNNVKFVVLANLFSWALYEHFDLFDQFCNQNKENGEWKSMLQWFAERANGVTPDEEGIVKYITTAYRPYFVPGATIAVRGEKNGQVYLMEAVLKEIHDENKYVASTGDGLLIPYSFQNVYLNPARRDEPSFPMGMSL